MNEINISTMPMSSFSDFLFRNERNRKTLYIIAASILLQFVVFKYLYPFASYIHGDSFSYLNAADKNLTINTYLVGYSKFLRLVSIFAKPDIVLVSLQYFLIQCSALFLLFTIFYFYRVSKYMQIILLSFTVFNPLFLHLGNLVSSDGLFLALSLTWFALLLWIIHKPSTKIIIFQAIILFLAFTVRYNAMIYPLIAAIAFGLSNLSTRKKLVGVSLGFLLCGWFVSLTMYQYKMLTGQWQYSPFSGWQFANNAMYAYRYVDSADRKPVSKKFRPLDNMIRNFYAHTRNASLFPSEKALASTFYMWSPGMPLMRYRDSLFIAAKDTTATEFKRWASVGPLYKDYGMHIIRKYPVHFAAYFLWPNARKYFAPPVEFLESYNSGRSYVTSQTKKWFGYNTITVKTRMKNPNVWILNFYPILSGVVNVLMIFGLLYYLLLKGWKTSPYFNKAVIIGGSLWLINACFTIFASSAALRFQAFPVILTSLLTLLLIDWMAQLLRVMKIRESSQPETEKQLSQQLIV